MMLCETHSPTTAHSDASVNSRVELDAFGSSSIVSLSHPRVLPRQNGVNRCTNLWPTWRVQPVLPQLTKRTKHRTNHRPLVKARPRSASATRTPRTRSHRLRSILAQTSRRKAPLTRRSIWRTGRRWSSPAAVMCHYKMRMPLTSWRSLSCA